MRCAVYKKRLIKIISLSLSILKIYFADPAFLVGFAAFLAGLLFAAFLLFALAMVPLN
jgi:hypothetical protein